MGGAGRSRLSLTPQMIHLISRTVRSLYGTRISGYPSRLAFAAIRRQKLWDFQ
jgi:hypothetical protein